MLFIGKQSGGIDRLLTVVTSGERDGEGGFSLR